MTDKQIIVINTVTAKKRALQAVNNCMADNVMQITVEPYQHDKTAAQRGFWHVLIGLLSDETGYTKPEMKNILKVEIMGTETVTDWNGREIEQIPSSEAERRFGYSKLIDGTYRIGAELGAILPMPNEHLHENNKD